MFILKCFGKKSDAVQPNDSTAAVESPATPTAGPAALPTSPLSARRAPPSTTAEVVEELFSVIDSARRTAASRTAQRVAASASAPSLGLAKQRAAPRRPGVTAGHAEPFRQLKATNVPAVPRAAPEAIAFARDIVRSALDEGKDLPEAIEGGRTALQALVGATALHPKDVAQLDMVTMPRMPVAAPQVMPADNGAPRLLRSDLQRVKAEMTAVFQGGRLSPDAVLEKACKQLGDQLGQTAFHPDDMQALRAQADSLQPRPSTASAFLEGIYQQTASVSVSDAPADLPRVTPTAGYKSQVASEIEEELP